jgi:hypothetical protein
MNPMFTRRRRRDRRSSRFDGCDGCAACCDSGLLSTALLSAAAVAPARRPRPSAADRAVLVVIRGYRRVSPRLPTRCRFTPTCSAYGLLAVERYGLRAGGRLTAARLAQCRPGVAVGTRDPVP